MLLLPIQDAAAQAAQAAPAAQLPGPQPAAASEVALPQAQIETDRHPFEYSRWAVFLQIAGSALMGGIGLDARPHENVSLRVGMGMYGLCWDGNCGVVPGGFFGASGLWGRREHMFEGGLEYNKFIGDGDASFISPVIGYRYQSSEGFFFRGTLQALIRVNDSDCLPWPGLSLGYAH